MWSRVRRWAPVRRSLPAARALACLPAALAAVASWRGRSPVDPGWYAAQGYGRRRGALVHYLLVGRRAGWSPAPLLEPSWVAPATWRRPFPEPLVRPVPARSTHPALTPGALAPGSWPGPAAATAVPVVLGRPVAYGGLRAAALAALRLRDEQEAVRTLPRVRTTWSPPSVGAVAPPPGSPRPVLATVTVVMPVLDRPAQVAEAIASVQAQTHREWQLVVVDDGSVDDTPDVVAALAARDPRIELVRADHGGVSAARNRGAERATGEVLAWLDSDNTWVPGHLRTMLTALAVTGAESAYAVMEQHDRHGVRYRALDAGREALRLQNHVDLNVLVARRRAVEAVGGFDPTLRRAVDYDLVLRLCEREEPVFVPVVGARYDERRDAADRITVREARTWSDVVRARRLVDWAGLVEGLGARVADRASVVVLVPRTAPAAVAVPTLLDALTGAGGDVEVVVVDAGGGRATGTALAVLAATDSRLRVLRWPAPMTPGWALAHALGSTSGACVVVVDAGTRLAPGTDLALRAELEHRVAVQRPGLLAVRADPLVRAGGADALDATPGWRAELVARLSPAGAASGPPAPSTASSEPPTAQPGPRRGEPL